MKDIDEIRRENLRMIERESSGPAAAARRVGMSPAQFTNLRDGARDSKTGKPRGMRKETARKIEKAAGKPEGWLDIGQPHEDSLDLNLALPLQGRVPVISWVQAGEFADVVELCDIDEYVETTVPVSNRTFALRIKSDSMEPDFPSGVIIVVEPDLEANPGDFVVVRNGDSEATFKQLVRDGADWYLKPLNRSYPTKPLGQSHIVGVAREMIKKLR